MPLRPSLSKLALLSLIAMPAALAGCGSPALTCQTQTCSTGNGKTYQLCVNTDDSETFNYGGMSCHASTMNTTELESCSTKVTAFCSEGSGGSGGTGGTGGAGGGSSGQPCTYTVSGAQTATGTCTAYGAVTPSNPGVVFEIVDGATLDFAATVTDATTLADGIYTEADAAPGFGGELTVGTTGGYLLCSSGDNCNDANGDPTPAQGSFDLDITDPGPSQGAGGSTLWMAPQGTLVITMPAVPGGALSGTVTVNVTL